MLVLVLPPPLELLVPELELLEKPKPQPPANALVDQAAALKMAMAKTSFLIALSSLVCDRPSAARPERVKDESHLQCVPSVCKEIPHQKLRHEGSGQPARTTS